MVGQAEGTALTAQGAGMQLGGGLAALGNWMAARVNERSEILNELNKPIYTISWTETRRHRTYTQSITITKFELILLILMWTGAAQSVVDAFKSMLTNFSKADHGPTDGMSLSNLNAWVPSYGVGGIAPVTPIGALLQALRSMQNAEKWDK